MRKLKNAPPSVPCGKNVIHVKSDVIFAGVCTKQACLLRFVPPKLFMCMVFQFIKSSFYP